MNNEEMKQFVEDAKKSVGNEAKLNELLAQLISDNTTAEKTLTKTTEELEKLKAEKTELQEINQKLFKQVEFQNLGKPNTTQKKEEKETKPISLNDIFDEKGNFKRSK